MRMTHEPMTDPYLEFLRAKAVTATDAGFVVEDSEINPILKPHQRVAVRWAVQGGRRAIFARFGLGKSVMQIEALRLVLERAGGRGLIVCPLGVRQEFMHDAGLLGVPVRFIRRIEEASETGIHLTNYETVRDGKLDPRHFTAASLDEASCLRGFGGTKTFREFMRLFAGDGKSLHARERGLEVPYRFVATATPSPNDYIELLAYSAYLGVMEVSQAKTRFFKRNSEKADQLTLHPHKEKEFWLWVATWALFIQSPADLGFDDSEYQLPALSVQWHEVEADHRKQAGEERDGQARMFADATVGVSAAARTKRESMDSRVAKLVEIVHEVGKSDQLVTWCDLNDEQKAIERALVGEGLSVSSLYGSQPIEERETLIQVWRDRQTDVFLSKPMMYGAGVNLQQSHTMVFVGIGFKAQDFLQAIHRIYRFLQEHPCTIHIIYSEAERGIRKILETKWQRHNEMVEQMSETIREYGLSQAAMAEALKRSIGVERIEVKDDGFRLVNADAVEEARRMESGSVDLLITSVPFATQYEYTPSYNDFGHTDNNAHFWRQMDFLTPELLRVVRPGRVAAIHVKDRIVPGGMTGLGFQTVNPFHCEAIAHYTRHGFAFLGMKTVVTDVVRENNQTYRLGWTEQCKDGTKMGAGMPEYVLLFRKPPSDNSNGYADVPVVKQKKLATKEGWENPDGYSRARWQLDAHGFMRSSGDRLLTPEELEGLPADQVYRIWREYSMSRVYDFEHHVTIGEALELRGALPPTFMLLPPASWQADVWTDVTRMLTLNGRQYAAGKEMHLCPLQFDIVDRLIVQFSMEGETVYDPFGGLMTVPYRAVKLRRKAIATELNPGYFLDGVKYVEAMAEEMAMPSLFDLLDADSPSEHAVVG